MTTTKVRKGAGADTGNGGHFAGQSRPDSAVRLMGAPETQTEALGGIVAAHVHERNTDRPRVLKDLSTVQQRAIHSEVQALDRYRGKPSGGRAFHRYEVLSAGEHTDVLYVQSRVEPWTYSEDIMRIELDREGNVLESNIGLIDQWGVQWMERDDDAAEEADDSGDDPELDDDDDDDERSWSHIYSWPHTSRV
jgi:hypothetical protein